MKLESQTSGKYSASELGELAWVFLELHPSSVNSIRDIASLGAFQKWSTKAGKEFFPCSGVLMTDWQAVYRTTENSGKI